DDGRQRAAFSVRQPKRHVTVLFGIMRRPGRFEQRIECRRWLDRIEPVAFVDGGALGDAPALGAALNPIEKTRKRGEVGFDRAEFLPHADNHRRLRDRPVLVQLDRRREQIMARPATAGGKSGTAAFDELLEWAAKPRHRNMPVGREGAAELFPFALVAVDAPGLDEFGDREFVGKFHWLRLARSTIGYSMIPKSGYRF